jgi:hypothetical protein
MLHLDIITLRCLRTDQDGTHGSHLSYLT